MTIKKEIIDELLSDYTNPAEILGETGLLKQLTKALVERCLETEMAEHLDEPKAYLEGSAKNNRRNGHSRKNIKGEFGQVEIAVLRDRNSQFEPQIVKKSQTRLEGFDEKILAL